LSLYEPPLIGVGDEAEGKDRAEGVNPSNQWRFLDEGMFKTLVEVKVVVGEGLGMLLSHVEVSLH
jgi:hypothetical protein